VSVLDAATRQARSLDHTEHRPWPIAPRGWTMGQSWVDLLFAHWRVPVDELRAYVPPDLEIEQHDGSAWLGVVPFRLTNLRARGTLPLPRVSSFLELNVRTCVRAADGKPGVWFLSLDASSRLAVELARRTYKLPYFHARMSATGDGEWIGYECARIAEPGRVFSGRYRPVGAVSHAKPRSLESFLMERYCLYATDERKRLHRAEIHHPPWPLQPAEAEIELVSVAPIALEGKPLCHFSQVQDVLVWPLRPVA
jgi:uncharacterized protein YqjF (DUF2071 family)